MRMSLPVLLLMAAIPAQADEDLIDVIRLYKQTPDGGSPVQLSGFGDASEARAMLQAAVVRAAQQ